MVLHRVTLEYGPLGRLQKLLLDDFEVRGQNVSVEYPMNEPPRVHVVVPTTDLVLRQSGPASLDDDA